MVEKRKYIENRKLVITGIAKIEFPTKFATG